MIDIDLLKTLADLGGLGVLALFIVTSFFVVRAGLALFKDQVLPLVRNHLEHLETSYDKMSDSLDKHASAIEGMSSVVTAQGQAIDVHNELTRELIARLPKNNKVKKLLE